MAKVYLDVPLMPSRVPTSKLIFLSVIGFLLSLVSSIGCGASVPESPGPTGALPDLRVRVPEGWDAPISFDPEGLSLRVAWTNQGQAMAENYSIALFIDGDLAHQWQKPLLAPGSIRTESVELGHIPNPMALGRGLHKLELILDPDDLVLESDESNNSFSVQRDFQFELPDLAPHIPENLMWDGPVVIGAAELVYGISSPAVDSGYYLAYSAINSGENAAKSWGGGDRFTVAGLAVQKRFVDTRGVSAPSPGEVQISVVPIWKIVMFEGPLLTGNHTVGLEIDVDDSVFESDEANNSISLEVGFPPSRNRTAVDQPDQVDVAIHLAYVLPADGDDEQWDINGTIEGIVASMQVWLGERADGHRLVLDSAKDSLDITFVRLSKTKDQIAEAAFTWVPIVEELYAAGFNDPKKIYAVWYPNLGHVQDEETVCGIQSIKEGVKFALSFFERLAPRGNRCMGQHTLMLHEIFHALGVVSSCAPNYARGHVSDDPNDLLYRGDLVGIMAELDKDRQDYFDHEIEGCPDAADSPYLQPPGR